MDYFLLNCLLALTGEKAFLSVCIRDRCTLGWRYLTSMGLEPHLLKLVQQHSAP